MTEPPKWHDERAVADFVGRAIDNETVVRAARQGNFEELKQFLATNAWKAGDTTWLAGLLRTSEQRAALKEETWLFIQDVALRGGGKRGPGRPPKSEDQHSDLWYVAEYFRRAQQILRETWPHERRIRERALEISAQSWGMDAQKLDNYLNRPKKERK